MRINFGRAIAGKMFDGGENAVFLQLVEINSGEIYHVLFRFSEAARVESVDKFFAPFINDVNDRSEIEI